MITDGFILPDREFYYDPRFDLRGCLLAFHSFLNNYRCGSKMFPEHFREICKDRRVNMRLVLAMMQTGNGLLKRKHVPSKIVMRHAILQPDRSTPPFSFVDQLKASVSFMRDQFDTANLTDPLHVKDTVVLPKSKLSYVLFKYLGEAGTKGYPDSGAFLYVRYFYQLRRFMPFY